MCTNKKKNKKLLLHYKDILVYEWKYPCYEVKYNVSDY